MEEKFALAWRSRCQQAQALGLRCKRTLDSIDADALKAARRCLDGNRPSDEFAALADLGRLDLSLEALVLKKEFGCLFTDDQVNRAIQRLLEEGDSFR